MNKKLKIDCLPCSLQGVDSRDRVEVCLSNFTACELLDALGERGVEAVKEELAERAAIAAEESRAA